MDDYKDIAYQGPNKEYTPQMGSLGQRQDQRVVGGINPYSKATLISILDQIIEETDVISRSADEVMKSFNLLINTEKLKTAQSAIWPSVVGDPVDYITYSQYKALLSYSDRASLHIVQQYRAAAQGEQGSGALDVDRVSSVINTEAKNIKGFLNDYSSEINDSAEQRSLEMLQDWASETLRHTGRLRSYFQARSPQDTSKIPDSEMVKIEKSEAAKYQSLFKAKINAINLNLNKDLEDFEKLYTKSSEIFYGKFLGPSIKFNRDIGTDLEAKSNDGTVLGREVGLAMESIVTNTKAALTDMIQRNISFFKKINAIEDKIGKRDSFKDIMKQLSIKSGNSSTKFIEDDPDPNTTSDLVSNLSGGSAYLDSFLSNHNSLSGRELDDAHPQYILKAGDTIAGDIEVEDDVKIGGIVFSTHEHNGLDGSSKISGSSLVEGTLSTGSVNVDELVDKPINLKVIDYAENSTATGDRVLDAKLIWESKNENQMYEIQILKRESNT